MTLWIIIALLVSLGSTYYGWASLRRGMPNKVVTFALGIVTCLAITMALAARGEVRGACPLMDVGELFLFIAWSLSLFFVLTGGTYRVSLLGLFTSPTIALFLGIVLVPGLLTENPPKAQVLDPWKESHAATSILAFGGLGLGALASLMFLILDKRLKLGAPDWISMKLPPVNTLISSVSRLLTGGVVILTIGIIAGIISSLESGLVHLVAAGAVWVAYCVLLIWYKWKGMPPRSFALWTMGLFIISCVIFMFI